MDYEHLESEKGRTGVARSLAGAELAREVARQELAGFKAERQATRLADAVRLARAVGLTVAEMERMAGVSRQTIYNAVAASKEKPTHIDANAIQREVLAVVLGSNGAVPIAEVASRLGREVNDVQSAVAGLAAVSAVRVMSAGYDQPSSWEPIAVAAEPRGEAALRARFDELFLGRAEAFSIYLAVDQADFEMVRRHAEQIVSSHEHELLPQTTAPSSMDSAELALAIHAPSSRMAILIASDLWDEIRSDADLDATPARVTAVIPPLPSTRAESLVVDSFTETVLERVDSDQVGQILRQRAMYAGGLSESTLISRCLTAAAAALRQSVGQDRPPRPIKNGLAAYSELCSVQPLRIDAGREAIQKPLTQALIIASAKLGPLPTGSLGSFKAPDGKANIVEEVRPSDDDYVQMARLAGEAVAAASRIDGRSAGSVIEFILSGDS